jgi:hypothetical protein
MEWFVVNNVDQQWTYVPLSGFKEPIPVCTVVYNRSGLSPAIVRIQNIEAVSFEIALQNPSGTPLAPLDVNCLVVEKGAWLMSNNERIEAHSFVSNVTDRKGSWVGQQQPDLDFYVQPVVIGQVISYNDARWSVFWSHGSSQKDPPSSTDFFAGKHVGEDFSIDRSDESVGYIVMEASHGKAGSVDYEAGITADMVHGYENGVSFPHKYFETFPSIPEVAIITQAGMDEQDGSWAVLSGTQSSSVISVAVDEDQIGNAERKHKDEQVAYIAFGSQGSLLLTAI